MSLLSTRAIYSSALQRKAFEQKILESLQLGKDHKKLAEYKKAQAVAASVMDLMSANNTIGSGKSPKYGQENKGDNTVNSLNNLT